uniref:Odorant binding protein n=1 Tax=Spodoptera exigua TaxID=7107 RepID=F1CEY1_SPOEX|nr:odorant binding protein [Spodoptera exigua]
MVKLTCVVFCAVAMALSVFVAGEDANSVFQGAIKPLIAECAKEYKLSDEELLKNRGLAGLSNLPPCFIGCVLKKFDIINDKGLYDAEAGIAKIEKLLPNNEFLDKISGVLKSCESANEKSVGDGDAGCERAVLVATCYLEHKTAVIA